MMECQNCQKWYHCSCLSLPTLSNKTTGKHIQFKWGRLSCNQGVFMYKVRGKEVFSRLLQQRGKHFPNNRTLWIKNSRTWKHLIRTCRGGWTFCWYKGVIWIQKSIRRTHCILLNLDKICTFGLGYLREKRKRVVDKIHSFIKLLEKKFCKIVQMKKEITYYKTQANRAKTTYHPPWQNFKIRILWNH